MKASDIRRLRYQSALGYVRNGNVSLVQALLKHSLIPVAMLEQHLPAQGTILDLGCGEGMLANLVARLSPARKVIGIDLDATRVEIARRNAAPNATFIEGDAFLLADEIRADAAILNDMVHHNLYKRHAELLAVVARHIRPGGVIVLKEVDQADILDRVWTSFFDRKLYPKDRLCFRTVAEWKSLLKRLGINEVAVERVRHPWPAARTLLFARRPHDSELRLSDNAEEIGDANLAVGADMTTVFITGATGFIGGHVARYLLEHGLGGKKVRLLLLTRDPERIPMDLRGEHVVPVIGELDDLPRLRQALRGVEFVFHFAAEVKFSGGADVWRHNYEGTVSLLEALDGLALKRFVYASTMGAIDRHPSDPCLRPLDESDEPYPLSEYGKSKLKAETAVRESGFDYTIVRVTWGYGPGMTPDTHVRNLMQGVYDRKIFSIFDFPGRVSIIAVGDLARVFVFVAEKAEAQNQIYFASDGRPVSLGDLFKLMGKMVGRPAAFIAVPRLLSAIARRIRRYLPLTVQNLNSDVLCASNQRLVELGFRPVISKREGLRILAQSIGLCPYKFSEGEQLISLVTGAASGIGRALAEQMHAQGHGLLLVDKDEERLMDFAGSLGADALCLDLTQSTSWDTLSTYIASKRYCLDWVVNNAGIGVRGLLTDVPFNRQQMVIELNCTAATFISRLALDNFRRAGHGMLINIASSSAFQPLPYMAVYAASKAYMLSFSRSITGEVLDLPGVHVLTVSPSGTATNFQSAAGVKQDPEEKLLSPEEVAAQILHAATRRKAELIVGNSGRMMSFAGRILPVALQIRLWRQLMKANR